MSNRKITEDLRTDIALASTAAAGGATSPLYVSMAEAQRIAVVAVAHMEHNSSMTVQMLQATSSAGAGSKNLGTAVVFTNDTHTHRDIIGRVEKMATDLDDANGFIYVGVKVTTVITTNAAALFIRTGILYRDGIAETQDPGINILPTTTAA